MFEKPTHLVRRLKENEVSSAAITKLFLEKNKYNIDINAICILLEKESIERAEMLDEHVFGEGTVGKLHGLPITIKECFDLIGTPSTFGVENRKDDFPEL